MVLGGKWLVNFEKLFWLSCTQHLIFPKVVIMKSNLFNVIFYWAIQYIDALWYSILMRCDMFIIYIVARFYSSLDRPRHIWARSYLLYYLVNHLFTNRRFGWWAKKVLYLFFHISNRSLGFLISFPGPLNIYICQFLIRF